MEYPKILYLSGYADLEKHVVVLDADEEKSARLDGYKGLNEEEPKPKRKGKQ